MKNLTLCAAALALAAGCAPIGYLKLPPGDRARYFELAAVGSTAEADTFLALADAAAREGYWRDYWKRLDPTPTTDRNERYQEHLHRVEYADQSFPAHDRRWDDRGMIYVKYGEPEEREAHPMGSGPWGAGKESVYEGPSSKQRDLPLTRGWELWTYGRMARQFKFVSSGLGYRMVSSLAAASEWQNKYVTTATSLARAELPGYKLDVLPASDYRHDFGPRMEFFFSLDRFADSLGAEVWLSYGVPLGGIEYDSSGTGLVERRVVITDDRMREAARDVKVLRPGRIAEPKALAEAQAVDVCRFELEPGEYTASISLLDLLTGRNGVYSYRFPVVDYLADQRPASDLMTALEITRGQDSSKFVRGGFRIVPQPGGAFKKGRTLFFYYELYGLETDQRGTCRVATTYYLIPEGEKNAFRAEPAVTEAPGSRLNQAAGVDLSPLGPGDHVLLVEARDMVSGKTRSLAKKFRIHE